MKIPYSEIHNVRISKTTKAIDTISQHSQDNFEVINVIENVADQTNENIQLISNILKKNIKGIQHAKTVNVN